MFISVIASKLLYIVEPRLSLGYPNAISNFKMPKDSLIFCKPSNK